MKNDLIKRQNTKLEIIKQITDYKKEIIKIRQSGIGMEFIDTLEKSIELSLNNLKSLD